jgi:Protein of unknown function C-terminus (DUF2399)
MPGNTGGRHLQRQPVGLGLLRQPEPHAVAGPWRVAYFAGLGRPVSPTVSRGLAWPIQRNAQLGWHSAPLVCLSGEPMAAGRRLVELLLAGGAGLRYHGDVDPDGIAIANSVIRPTVAPRRFVLLAAVNRTPVREELGPGLVHSSWDGELADAMAAAGARIYEEHVLDDLLIDLAATPTAPRRGGTR